MRLHHARLPSPVPPLLVLVAIVLALTATTVRAAPEGGQVEGVSVVPAWPGVRFENPVRVVSARDGTGTLYVGEQKGLIKAMPRWSGQGPVPTPVPFLDLRPLIYSEAQGGLLGIAFHPDFKANGRFFVSYLRETGATQPAAKFAITLAEFRAAGGRCQPGSQRVLLQIPKSLALHNGGCLVFGPDGYLYMSTGDNKIQKQAVNTSQSPASLLGKILRIDVDRPAGGLPYGIPADNPWTEAAKRGGIRGEIWAYGFRNPWGIAFDAQGNLWTAEPGTKGECRECVVKIQRGANHGWPFFEGTRPMEPLPANLQGATFVRPVYEYLRTGGEGTTAALGGFFYRGQRVPKLQGQYVFGDYGRGAVWVLRIQGGQGLDMRTLGAVKTLSSIGEDEDGELYFTSHEDGLVYTLR